MDFKMNPEVKKAWVSLLRSGEIKQARRALNTGDGMCCLGVLCELHRRSEEGKHISWLDDTSDDNFKCFGYANEVSVLPQSVMDWAGLRAGNPGIDNKDGFKTSVAELNDTAGYKFNEIADLIEEQF